LTHTVHNIYQYRPENYPEKVKLLWSHSLHVRLYAFQIQPQCNNVDILMQMLSNYICVLKENLAHEINIKQCPAEVCHCCYHAEKRLFYLFADMHLLCSSGKEEIPFLLYYL